MGWLNKIFKGSDHRISEGQYHENYAEDPQFYAPSSSGDTWSECYNEDIDRAIALSLAEEEQKKKPVIDNRAQLEEDEQLAWALQESLNVESPRIVNRSGKDTRLAHGHRHGQRLRHGQGQGQGQEQGHINGQGQGQGHEHGQGHGHGHGHGQGQGHAHGNGYQPVQVYFPLRICAGCNNEIGHGRFLNCLNGFWHPECFRCHACHLPISDYEFSMTGNYPYHKTCYKERYHPKCDVCNHFIPANLAGLIEYRAHPFWVQKYCPSHEHDGTPRCCSCERMEPRDTIYVPLNDGRKLCLECLDSAVMDTSECQPLHFNIQQFYESLNMKVEQDVPLLLVERQALNEAREGEKNGHYHMPETRGLCLSEEQTVSTVLRRPKFGTGMITEPYKLTRRCEVTAILILYGLPRLLTGSILAHEMMHAWMRLKGFRTLSQDVEEGICQVMAHLWLSAQLASISGVNISSASSSYPSSRNGQRADISQLDTKLGEFFKHQIESDTSPVYGDGFRAGLQAVQRYGLKKTLDHIMMTGRYPY